MDIEPVATNDSVSLAFCNNGGSYRARLDVRPRSRPDGTLVVNTEVDLSVGSVGQDGNEEWDEFTTAGAVYVFPPGDQRCEGGVGVSLADGSAHIEVTWSGERLGESGVLLTAVTARLSSYEMQ